jgi:hypothetical protein
VGAIEVILGVSFPLIILYAPEEPVLLSGISVAIAIAAALAAFFGWSQNWQLHRSQELVMDALVARWNLQMLMLLNDSEEPIDRKGRALRITEELSSEVIAAREHHHNVLFNLVVTPEELIKKHGQPVKKDGQPVNGESQPDAGGAH